MEAIRGTWSIGGIALGPIRICPRMGRTDTAGPTLSPEEELEAQRKKLFDFEPRLSIAIPAYKTPERYLKETPSKSMLPSGT